MAAAAIASPPPHASLSAVAKGVNASQVFNAMLESPGGASSAATHNLVRAAALQGDAATALQIVDHLDSASPAGADQQDYANLIRAQGMRRDLPAVEGTLQRIRDRGAQLRPYAHDDASPTHCGAPSAPGLVPNHAVYLSAIKAFAHGRNLDRAFALVNCMAEDGLRPTMREYAALIEGCAVAGQFERGWDTYIFVRTVRWLHPLLAADTLMRVPACPAHQKLFLLDPEPCLYNAMIQCAGPRPRRAPSASPHWLPLCWKGHGPACRELTAPRCPLLPPPLQCAGGRASRTKQPFFSTSCAARAFPRTRRPTTGALLRPRGDPARSPLTRARVTSSPCFTAASWRR